MSARDSTAILPNCKELPAAILYERYSPRPDHAECESLDVQHERLLRYCTTAMIYPGIILRDPLVSARKEKLDERPEGSKISEIVRTGTVKHIVVMKLARIFRDVVDGLTKLDEWNKLGVSLHCADEGGCTINTGTAKGYLIATFLLGVASYEPRETGERTSNAMLHYQNVNNRRMGGKVKFGWEVDPDSEINHKSGENSGIRENAEEQQALLKLRELKSKDWTITDIAKVMNEMEVLCRGRKWTAEKVKRILNRKE